jgi:hypothetical protein
VDGFVALNRSPCCLKFSEALLGVHSTFDGSMILFQNVVQVLHGSVVVFDASGNLYGTALNGGSGCAPYGCGIVWEITP